MKIQPGKLQFISPPAEAGYRSLAESINAEIARVTMIEQDKLGRAPWRPEDLHEAYRKAAEVSFALNKMLAEKLAVLTLPAPLVVYDFEIEWPSSPTG